MWPFRRNAAAARATPADGGNAAREAAIARANFLAGAEALVIAWERADHDHWLWLHEGDWVAAVRGWLSAQHDLFQRAVVTEDSKI